MNARIQRKRTKGWRAPEGAIYVGRGTRWGNPTRVVYRRDTGGWHAEYDNGAGVGTFPTAAEARKFATEAYRHHLDTHPYLAKAVRQQLTGRDLMCWCPPGEPCHADVLLEVANPDAVFTADQWNARYPVGTPVVAYPFTRPEHRAYDPRDRLDTVTRTPAWTLGHGVPVVSVEGYAGGISLEHVDVIDLYADTRGEPGESQ